MNDNYLTRYFTYYKLFELIFCIAIIGILAYTAVSCYIPLIRSAKTFNFTSSFFYRARTDSMYYHAIKGEWPKDIQQASTFVWEENYEEEKGSYVDKVFIEGGAINIIFSNTSKMHEKILTMRPAVPAGDPLGPVQWICGDIDETEGWLVYGKDRTNIDKQYIHRDLRRQ